MKKILFAIALFSCFEASAQHSYISSSGNVYLVSGSTERYGSPDIYVDAQYNTITGTWVATLSLFATGTTTGIVKTFHMSFDDATIDALTASGANTTRKIKNCLLQAVEVELIASTGSDIFTLN
mgnify:FL=1